MDSRRKQSAFVERRYHNTTIALCLEAKAWNSLQPCGMTATDCETDEAEHSQDAPFHRVRNLSTKRSGEHA